MKIPALIPTKGAEIGVRTLIVPKLQSTISLWYLHSASELQQDGDTGGTVASQQPSNRYGIEWANYYTPREHLTFDFDLADSKALFTSVDPDDAAPGSPGGRWVPEAVGWVVSSGLTLHDVKGFSSSLRLRYFGPRDLTSDKIYRSSSTALLNAEVGYQFNRRWRISAEFLNLLNRRDHDIDYAYTSQIAPTAAPEFTYVFHPVEPFQARFGAHLQVLNSQPDVRSIPWLRCDGLDCLAPTQWRFLLATNSVLTKSSRPSAQAAWAQCIVRATHA